MRQGFLRVPNTKWQWKKIALIFISKFNLARVISVLDGKQIVKQGLHKFGSRYLNYKKTHSIVLFSIWNAKYQVILVDIWHLIWAKFLCIKSSIWFLASKQKIKYSWLIENYQWLRKSNSVCCASLCRHWTKNAISITKF